VGMSAQTTTTAAAVATAPQREGKRPRLAKSRAEGLNVVVAGGGIAGMWISMLRRKCVCCKDVCCVSASVEIRSRLHVRAHACVAAGLAVAVALQRRGCNNVVVYERDESFDQRPQGYGAWQHTTTEASAHSKLDITFLFELFLFSRQLLISLALLSLTRRALCHSHSHRRSHARIHSRAHLNACSLKLRCFFCFCFFLSTPCSR
jgi:hypothetical protein